VLGAKHTSNPELKNPLSIYHFDYSGAQRWGGGPEPVHNDPARTVHVELRRAAVYGIDEPQHVPPDGHPLPPRFDGGARAFGRVLGPQNETHDYPEGIFVPCY
jgi:hypothetical protein